MRARRPPSLLLLKVCRAAERPHAGEGLLDRSPVVGALACDQNFSPSAVRTVLMWIWSPLSGANCTHSHSVRRKTLDRSATSTPRPAAAPYAKAPLRPSVSVTGRTSETEK